MGDVVNLRRVRKTRERADRAEEAARSRAAFGRTREERSASADENRRAEAKLDAHRLRTPHGGAPDDVAPR